MNASSDGLPERVLVVCANFPSGDRASDGQAVYVNQATRALALQLSCPIDVVALRVGDQSRRESSGGITVHRVDPPIEDRTVFPFYEPRWFPSFVRILERAALRIAGKLDVAPQRAALWCHGFETGGVAKRLRRRGHPVVSVLHFLVAEESRRILHYADDPVRARALTDHIGVTLSRLILPPLRDPLLRLVSAMSGVGHRIGGPAAVRTQLQKLALERMLLGASHGAIAVGRNFAQTVARHYPRCRQRLTWCRAGIEPNAAVTPQWPFAARPAALRLVLAGRLVPQKGWEHALSALHTLERDHPVVADRIELVAVGGSGDHTTPLPYAGHLLEELARFRRIRVHHTGHVERAYALGLFAGAHALLFPSVFEPFGLVMVEAMAAGCQIIASQTDGGREIVSDEFGWLVPLDEPAVGRAGIVMAVLELAQMDAPTVRRRSDAARSAATQYSWSTCAAEHARVLRQVTRELATSLC